MNHENRYNRGKGERRKVNQNKKYFGRTSFPRTPIPSQLTKNTTPPLNFENWNSKICLLFDVVSCYCFAGHLAEESKSELRDSAPGSAPQPSHFMMSLLMNGSGDFYLNESIEGLDLFHFQLKTVSILSPYSLELMQKLFERLPTESISATWDRTVLSGREEVEIP